MSSYRALGELLKLMDTAGRKTSGHTLTTSEFRPTVKRRFPSIGTVKVWNNYEETMTYYHKGSSAVQASFYLSICNT